MQSSDRNAADEEAEEPKLTVLTKQHKNAIRSIRKVKRKPENAHFDDGFHSFSFFVPPDQVLRCQTKIQRGSETIRCKGRHRTIQCWTCRSAGSDQKRTDEVICGLNKLVFYIRRLTINAFIKGWT